MCFSFSAGLRNEHESCNAINAMQFESFDQADESAASRSSGAFLGVLDD